MRLKLDENLGRRGETALTAGGHDVSTVVGQGLAGTVDPVLIDRCRAENRALVTLDMGFANPLVFPPREYHGIIVLRPTQSAAARRYRS